MKGPLVDEEQQRSTRRPSRRTLLIAGAVAGGGVVAGTAVTLSRGRDGHGESPETSESPNAPSPSPSSPWAERDERFLATLRPSRKTIPLARTFSDAFPSLKLRDVVPLDGLGDPEEPWVAATIIGPSNQLQITRTGESSPGLLMDVPSTPSAEILCMAWDRKSQILYLSAGGTLWAWRPAKPSAVSRVADIPGARVLYEILVDPHGVVWGGTYPLGAVFNYLPESGRVQVFSRMASDSDYVRRVALDAHGQLWVGTGARNPRLFTFPRTNPETRVEIPLPEPQDTGFIMAIRAGASVVRATADGIPDVLEMDSRTRTWTRRFSAEGWVRPPSTTILRDDVYYMAQNGDLRSHEGTTSVSVGEADDATGAALHLTSAGTVLSTPSQDGFTLTPTTASSRTAARPREVNLRPGKFGVQSILAHTDGTVYVGGFMGSGLAGIDPDTDERWASPDDLEVVHQIENMISVGPDRLYLGTYSWADIIRCDTDERDVASSYARVARYSTRYHQSRPFGLAANSRSLFVGTVPNYGRSGGILAMIDLDTDTPEWVLDGDGEGFIAGHSLVGLAADDVHVYGTTSVRNGSGAEDTEGPAQVFKLDIATREIIWQTAPVPSTGALYAPHLVAGWLLVADLEGVNVIDPRTGRIRARHRLSSILNSSQRPGWATADLAVIDGGRRIVHSAAGFISIVDFLTAQTAEVTAGDQNESLGPRTAVSPTGRLFTTVKGTDLVELTV